jgi:hypothetical protein
MPTRMRQLPRDGVGRPIPFFAAEVDGVHDFRLMDGAKLVAAVREQLCWVCGTRLGRVHGSTAPKGTFVAGPMCVVNRTSAEPPSHFECAEWSAKACPFLTKPAKVRREGDLPDNLAETPGIMIARNPGVTALIDCNKWRYYRVGSEVEGAGDGVLFNFTQVVNVRWMARGALALTTDVMEAIESGLPALVEMAETEDGAMRALAFKMRDALKWVGGADTRDYPTIAKVLLELP